MSKLISTNPAKSYRVVGSANISTPQEVKQKWSLLKKQKLSRKNLALQKELSYSAQSFTNFLRKEKNLRFLSQNKQVNQLKKAYEPIGVVAIIVPWNFPFDNFLRGVIPNLIAGNTVVFKHSEKCPLTGKLIGEVMNKSDLPKGVFSEVYGDEKVGEILVEQDIDLTWFTGSTKVGKWLYEIAGKKFIKAILEMGDSNRWL